LAAFAIGTVCGVLNEYVQKPHQPCYQRPEYSHFLTCGACNVYGWSVVALTGYFDLMTRLRVPPAILLLAVSPILTVLEAAMGVISQWYFKEQRWCYPASYYPACGGTVSLVSGVYFAVAGVLYWYVLYKPLISKL
jgi:hypothetical protein